jgi:hypothetical protein
VTAGTVLRTSDDDENASILRRALGLMEDADYGRSLAVEGKKALRHD